MTTIVCLLYRSETEHCSTKNAYTSEITASLHYDSLEPIMKVLKDIFIIVKIDIKQSIIANEHYKLSANPVAAKC